MASKVLARVLSNVGAEEPHPLGKGPSLGWQWKAIIPLVRVLLPGLIAFQAIVVALDIPERSLDFDRSGSRCRGDLLRHAFGLARADRTAVGGIKEDHRAGEGDRARASNSPNGTMTLGNWGSNSMR